jgi:DNA-directed RNA polymerase specialized sigma24 family protein
MLDAVTRVHALLPMRPKLQNGSSRQINALPNVPKLGFTMAETAKVLGIHYISVHRLLKRGLLHSSSALRTKIIPLTEIERFLKVSLQ